MRKFTQLIESRRTMSASAENALRKEISEFLSKMSGKLTDDILLASSILNKYSIYDKSVVSRIAAASKSDIKRLADEFSMEYKDAEEIQFLLRKIDKEGKLRLIPIMMSSNERNDLVSGRKSLEDITIDLETDRGRTAIVNEYKSLVSSIAGKFVNRCGLDRGELVSAGLEGLVKAMNSYRKPGTEYVENLDIEDSEKKEGAKVKGLSFRQYAGWCIRNNILSEINNNSRTVRINTYQYNKMKERGDMSGSFIKSIDQLSTGDSEEGTRVDRIPELGEEPSVFKHDYSKDDERFKELYKIIDAKFSTKEATVFYRIFGANGFPQVSARTIASEMGVTENRISQIKTKIILYLRSNPKAMEILSMLRDMYTESLIVELFSLPKEQIYERLISDDLYILLETVTKWDSKERLSTVISGALESIEPSEADYIVNCLKDGFDYIDSTYRGRKKTIVGFLSIVEPTETFSKRSDAYILDRMLELSDMCKKYNLYRK